MAQSEQTYNWTTLDEINYVHHIALGFSHIPMTNVNYLGGRDNTARVQFLRQYIRVAQHRDWTGVGMRVDAHAVILQSMEWLDELTGCRWKMQNKLRGIQ